MSVVDLDFARQTLKEVAEWRTKIKNEYPYAFKFEYRVPHTQELYNSIDTIGKDVRMMEKARIQQVVRESIESVEPEIEELVRQKLKQTSYLFDTPVPPESTVEATKSIAKKTKPWLPRVATLPPRWVALERKNRENQNVITTEKASKNVLNKPKVKSISQLMETEVKSPRYDVIEAQYKSVFQTQHHDAAVQTQVRSPNEKVIVPSSRRPNRTLKADFQSKTAIALSSPVQLIVAPDVLNDSTSTINMTQFTRQRTKRTVRRNVAVVNIINEEYRPKQLSVQSLPSVSIECKSSQPRRVVKNVELYFEKAAENDSSLDSTPSKKGSLTKITHEGKTGATKIQTTHSTTQTLRDTKNVSTSVPENGTDSIVPVKPPVDSTTVRQLLHQLIASLNEEVNGVTTPRRSFEIKKESPLVPEPKADPIATESRGMLTDTSETKSQFVSMEIETRSQGVTTNEKFSKTQEVQVEIEHKQFKDVSTLAEDLKETKDVSIPAKDFGQKENKEIAVQVSAPDVRVVKILQDKATEMNLEYSSESSDSSEIKINTREIGIQVSSSGTNLSRSNESSSSALAFSGTTTTSSSTSTSNISPDEPISEGEVIFKRPYRPLPGKNQMASRNYAELSVTEEYDEDDPSVSNSEGETDIKDLNSFLDSRPLESAQSVGEVVNLMASISPGEANGKKLGSESPIQVIDGDSGSSSGEISRQ